VFACLAANSGLWPAIERALARSRHFILLAGLALVAWYERGSAVTQTHRAEHNATIATRRQHVAERRLKALCDAWNIAVDYVTANVAQGAVYDIKGALYKAFPFDDNCRSSSR
jgi:hypothetical protein